MSAFRRVVDTAPSDDPDRAGKLSNLGLALRTRFEADGNTTDLDEAIQVGRQAVAATPTNHRYRARHLSALSAALSARFEQTGSPADLDEAIQVGRQAVDATQADDPERATILSNLGRSLQTRFERTADSADIDEAIQVGRQAVAATPPDHHYRAKHLSNLGTSLRLRFEQTGNNADSDEAVQTLLQAVEATPADHPEHAKRLSALNAALSARFERAGIPDEIIQARHKAPTPADDAEHLTSVGVDAAEEYQRTGRLELLEGAVSAFRQALTAAAADDPRRATILSNLVNSLTRLFERTGNTADLDEAIQLGRQALDAAPTDHPDRAMYLSNLGISLRTRYERTGNTADLDDAIKAGRQAVDATPTGQINRVMYLSNLGNSLAGRSERTGNTADLDEAIKTLRQAVDATPTDHPDRAMYLSNLEGPLLIRFERTGNTADLDEAIKTGRQAVDAVPTDHPDRARHLSNLEASLRTRFQRTGSIADLDEAIKAGRQAVDAVPTDHPDRVMFMSNLGVSLFTRFERTGNTTDLDEAIKTGRQAVDAVPTDHPNRVMFMSNLGNSLTRRFERTGNTADLDEAIKAGRQAVDTIPPDDPDRPRYLANLEGPLLIRFERIGNTADLEEAIQLGRQAVAATPANHPDRAKHLSNLGASLHIRFERTRETADLDEAIGCCRQVSWMKTATPTVRLEAARRWGAMAADAERIREAAEGYRVAVELLPVVAWHGLDRVTREEQLARWTGLASDAAACAILDGHPDSAVELLEQGRSVLWGQALNLRTDLTHLKEKAPDLAEQLDELRAVLDEPFPDTSQALPGPANATATGRAVQAEEALELRQRLAREWDQTLTQVRALEGFEHFLRSTPYAELATVAVDGPVVLLNTSRYGCHALIAHADTQWPQVVDLPDLTMDTVIEHAITMLEALEASHRTGLEWERARHAILDVLDWLWDVIAEPVLTTLSHTSSSSASEPSPRVWWCPTGLLNMLPIHAAGHHPRLNTTPATTSKSMSVADRVVSSYTPTLTALARAREPGSPDPARHLTVGMPTTPNLPDLPAVARELRILARYFPSREMNAQLVGPEATRAAVLDAMATHSWVHLACHAGQEQADPTRSGFALWDGTLTIADLTAQPTQRREMAFLSACETVTGSVRHLDEAIHLAAAMQFLGYRHVIATMWTIADSPAPDIADDVYTTLTTGGTPDASRCARALHDAVQALRQKDPTNPLTWGPYNHLGA